MLFYAKVKTLLTQLVTEVGELEKEREGAEEQLQHLEDKVYGLEQQLELVETTETDPED